MFTIHHCDLKQEQYDHWLDRSVAREATGLSSMDQLRLLCAGTDTYLSVHRLSGMERRLTLASDHNHILLDWYYRTDRAGEYSSLSNRRRITNFQHRHG